jgi:hypothetical protein
MAFHVTREPMKAPRLVYDKIAVVAEDAAASVPPFIMDEFKSWFDTERRCARCSRWYLECKNLANHCAYHPMGPTRYQKFACCGASSVGVLSGGCTPCDHSRTLEWTYGPVASDGADASVVAVPCILLALMEKPAKVLKTIRNPEQEFECVSHKMISRGTTTLVYDVWNTRPVAFVPAELQACKFFNENLAYENNDTYYERCEKEFIEYAIIERISSQ